MRTKVLMPHLGVVFLAVTAGWLVTYGGPIGVAGTASVAAGSFFAAWVWRHPSIVRIEVPIALLLLSTLVLRARDHEALAENPLDPAGMYRVAAVGLAGLIAVTTLLYGLRRAMPVPFKAYGLYVLSVFLAVPLSLYPAQTAYRGVELLVGGITFLAIWRFYGEEGIKRAGRVLFAFLVVSLVVLWVEIAVVPGAEVQRIPGSFIPFRIGGYLPTVSANDVGFYGVLLFLWCLVRLTDEKPVAHPMRLRLLALLGLVSLIGAQYRTGYVCAIVGLLILGFMRTSYKLTLASVAGICLVLILWPGALALTSDVHDLWRRGEAVGTAPTLTGRMDWWNAAIPVWQESPVFGKGLLTATRFEVMAPMGWIPSTIHNGWVEALVGTGVLGVALLLVAVLSLLWRTLRRARIHECFPLVLLSVLLVRSVTGSSFEIFGYGALLFVFLCFTTERHT